MNEFPLQSEAVAPMEQSSPGARIMLVDDEANILDLMSRHFGGIGYETLTIQNPRLALESYKNFAPHVVVMDYKMPWLTGLSVAEQLKRYDPDCRVFLLTAYADSDVQARAQRTGIRGCFSKPVNFPALTKAVTAARKR